VERALFDEARASLRAKEVEGADFWSVVGETELQLYEAIADGRLAERQQALVKSYGDLAARVRGGTKWGSVYDTASFVLSRHVKRARGAAAPEVAAAQAILDYLRKQASASQ